MNRILLAVGWFFALIGFLQGVDSHDEHALNRKDSNGCVYTALIDYNPSRIITCELLRNRWCAGTNNLSCNYGGKK